jgi:hypothetical protein
MNEALTRQHENEQSVLTPSGDRGIMTCDTLEEGSKVEVSLVPRV